MSDFKTMLQVNGNVNVARQINRLPVPWLTAVIESPIAPDETKARARDAIGAIEEFDVLLARGYVSTGYQYDDDDPRNQQDANGDYYWDDARQAARTGSSPAEEAEAEIALTIAVRRAREAMEDVKDFFKDYPPEALFSPDDEHYMTLADWVSDGTMWIYESHRDQSDY